MKNIIIIAFFAICTSLFAQPDTEVFLFDILDTDGKIEFTNLKSVSNGNEGYDNQPSFYDDNTILFASTRNGQTDIAAYDIQKGTTSWITNTGFGSEYSPLKIPNEEAISYIRADTNGLQLLYKYNLKDKKPKVLVEDLVVGYHVWYDENILISTVLIEDKMDLVVSNLEDKTNRTVHKNVGRSLHKIPNTNLVSFISKQDKTTWMIKSINPITGTINDIKSIPANVADMCWMDDAILQSTGKGIVKFNPKTDKDFSIIHQFEEREIIGISRMTVSSDGKHLAVVSSVYEIPPEIVVQKQVDAFNEADLDGFAACYSENAIAQNFPNDTNFVGNDNLKSSYKNYFANNKTKVEVLKRMVVGKNVIDEELVTANGREYRQVAIYQVKKDKIASMTFIHQKKTTEKVESVVEEQLAAYNARDINAFIKTYADDIQVFDFPKKMSFEGQEELNKIFTDLFTRTPDLHCEIKNRILIGNISIDEESVLMNGNYLRCIAIYEIEDGKIKRVTFLM